MGVLGFGTTYPQFPGERFRIWAYGAGVQLVRLEATARNQYIPQDSPAPPGPIILPTALTPNLRNTASLSLSLSRSLSLSPFRPHGRL